MTTYPSLPARDRESVLHSDGSETHALYRRVRALALSLVSDEGAADDLVQDAWVAALGEPPGRVRNPGAWLRQVVRNLAQSNFRRAERRREVEGLSARSIAIDGPSPVELHSTAQLVHGAIEEMREPYRGVLAQRFLEERSVLEIARRSEVSRETVKSQLRRGIEILRVALDRKHGGDRTLWMGMFLPFASAESAPPAPDAAASESLRPIHALGRVRPTTALAFLAPTAILGAILLYADARNGPAAERFDSTSPATLARTELSGPNDAAFPAATNAARRETEARAAAVEEASTATRVETRALELFVTDSAGRRSAGAVARIWGAGGKTLGEYRSDDQGRILVEVPTTELEGAPRIEGPNGGVGVMGRTANGSWSWAHNLELPPEGRSFELTSPTRARSIVGSVLDEGFRPIANAVVVFEPELRGVQRDADGNPYAEYPHRVTTDADGVFEFEHLRTRPYHVLVRGPGFLPERRVLPGGEQMFEAEFMLRRGGVLRGRVLRSDGTPVAHARVWEAGIANSTGADLPSTRTDERGEYELAGLEPGPRRIFACDPADEALFASRVITATRTVEGDWSAILERGRGVRVRTVDATGEPLAGAAVTLLSSDVPHWTAFEITDAHGLVEFPHVPDASLALAVQRNGADARAILLHDGIVPSSEERLVTVAEREGASLEGTLLDASGEPFERAIVVACADYDVAQAEVDANGAFVFDELPAALCELWAAVEGVGYVDVGRCELLPGLTKHAGTIHALAPERVTLAWTSSVPEPGSPWIVEAVGRGAKLLGRTILVLDSARESIDLTPGPYRLRRAADDNQSGIRFEVGVGAAARVSIGD